MGFKKYRMMIQFKKCFYLERKQKGLHRPLKSDPNYFGRCLKKKMIRTLPFTPQEAVDYCTKLYTSRQIINDHVVMNIQLFHVFTVGGHMLYLANHKASDIHGLKPEFLKWATNDMCEPITLLFNLVAKEGLLASWTINIIQMIFKSSENHSLGNCRTIMLGAIFGKLNGSILKKIIR